MDFKYEHLSPDGLPTNLFTRKGTLNDEGLLLHKLELPPSSFVVATAHGNRVIISYRNSPNAEPESLVLNISKAKPIDLVYEFNRAASANHAKRRQQELQAEGRGDEFRSTECRHCRATVMLAEFPISPEFYCLYCDCVQPASKTDEDAHHIHQCERCGYYDSPSRFTNFFLCFLLAYVEYRYHVQHLCSDCARKTSTGMLLKNFIFIFGIPHSMYQWIRVRRSKHRPPESYLELINANKLARANDIDGAIAGYDSFAAKKGGSAIASINKGFALGSAKRIEEAVAAFEEALLDCSNFENAGIMLAACLNELGKDLDDNPILAPFLQSSETGDEPEDTPSESA